MKYRNREKRSLACKECGEIVENVGHDAAWVICHRCVSANLRKFNTTKNKGNNVQDTIRDSE